VPSLALLTLRRTGQAGTSNTLLVLQLAIAAVVVAAVVAAAAAAAVVVVVAVRTAAAPGDIALLAVAERMRIAGKPCVAGPRKPPC